MRAEPVDISRNFYRFDLTREETVNRIYECLHQTNPMIRRTDIIRKKNSKEYFASFVNERGEPVQVSIGVQNLKRYFGSRNIMLNDDTEGVSVWRVVKKKVIGRLKERLADENS